MKTKYKISFGLGINSYVRRLYYQKTTKFLFFEFSKWELLKVSPRKRELIDFCEKHPVINQYLEEKIMKEKRWKESKKDEYIN